VLHNCEVYGFIDLTIVSQRFWLKHTFQSCGKRQLPIVLLANQLITSLLSKFIPTIKGRVGFDVADSDIVEHLQTGELVIIGDML